MAKKLKPLQVAREINKIVETFSGKRIEDWFQEALERSRKTTIGQATAGMERAARAMDPYAVLGLNHGASTEDVKTRYRQLAKLFHPDVGGNDVAMKLVNNAYQQITREKGES